MAQISPSFVNPMHFSHMGCQVITPTLLPPPLKVTNTQHLHHMYHHPNINHLLIIQFSLVLNGWDSSYDPSIVLKDILTHNWDMKKNICWNHDMFKNIILSASKHAFSGCMDQLRARGTLEQSPCLRYTFQYRPYINCLIIFNSE